MKILIVSRGCPTEEYPLNGIFEFDQARALKKAGYDIIFASIDLRSIRRWRKWGKRNFVKDGVPVVEVSLPCGRLPRCVTQAVGKLAYRWIHRIVEKSSGSPEIVHAHFWDVADYCAKFVTREKIRFVVTEHSSMLMEDSIKKTVIRIAGRVYEKADRVIVVSKALKNRIYDIFQREAEIVWNILDEKSFPIEMIEKQNGKDGFTFVSCGNLIARKGFDVLLKAFSRISEKEARLVILGDGPLREELKGIAKQLGISERVCFKGRQSRKEIREIYLESDCFVLASRKETFGVVYIEAMACGLPVIATCCGGPEDIVTKEVGVLVQVDDEIQLQEAMEHMVLCKGCYEPQVCIEQVKNRYSANAITSRIEEIYLRLYRE